jgi:outer membrane protein OmpA-like peptidoglycan-associated protein
MKNKIVLPVLFIAFHFLISCQPEHQQANNAKQNTPNSTTENPSIENKAQPQAAQELTTDAPKQTKRKLACGTEIVLPDDGIESKILQKIESGEKPSEDAWLGFDQLAFKPDGASLDMPKSIATLSNVAQILKCYPKLKLKIGAFGNGGDEKISVKTAGILAETVKATLVGLGAPPTGLQAEGFGKQPPKGAIVNAKQPFQVIVQILKT